MSHQSKKKHEQFTVIGEFLISLFKIFELKYIFLWIEKKLLRVLHTIKVSFNLKKIFLFKLVLYFLYMYCMYVCPLKIWKSL